jgi:hypothetical protein
MLQTIIEVCGVLGVMSGALWLSKLVSAKISAPIPWLFLGIAGLAKIAGYLL